MCAQYQVGVGTVILSSPSKHILKLPSTMFDLFKGISQHFNNSVLNVFQTLRLEKKRPKRIILFPKMFFCFNVCGDGWGVGARPRSCVGMCVCKKIYIQDYRRQALSTILFISICLINQRDK